MENDLLVLKGVKKTYKQKKDRITALKSTDLEIKKGEVLGLVGESGSGKSTLANIIVRLIKSDDGTIVFKGEDISTLKDHEFRRYRRDIQMVFQDPYSSLNPKKTIRYLLEECLKIHEKDMGAQKRLEVVKESLEEVGLDSSYLERYPKSLSGGQRQRVAIALALILRPSLIVLDEAVSALDVSVEAQILNLLLDLREKHGLTYLFISHDLAVVSYVSDRIAVMYKGSIVEIAKADDVISSMAHPYTKALFEASENMAPLTDNKEKKEISSSHCSFCSRCKYRKERCFKEEPTLIEIKEGHSVACFYPLGE